MKKSIIISIKPEWVEKILNGEKTIEIRKSIPKCELPIDVYIYCSKSDLNLYKVIKERYVYFSGAVAEPFDERIGFSLTKEKINKKYRENTDNGFNDVFTNALNGKIVAKFTLNKVIDIIPFKKQKGDKTYINYLSNYGDVGWGNQTCLNTLDFENYLGLKNGYGWIIDNLEIFDEPLELGNFFYECKKCEKRNGCKGCLQYYYNCNESIGVEEECLANHLVRFTKAPQSWCYAYKEVI